RSMFGCRSRPILHKPAGREATLRHRAVLLVLTASAILTVAGCQKAAAPLAPPEVPKVVVAAAVEQNVTDQEEFTGRIEPVETIEVRPRVSGLLLKVNPKFKEGGEVAKDEVLFEIDPPLFEAE